VLRYFYFIYVLKKLKENGCNLVTCSGFFACVCVYRDLYQSIYLYIYFFINYILFLYIYMRYLADGSNYARSRFVLQVVSSDACFFFHGCSLYCMFLCACKWFVFVFFSLFDIHGCNQEKENYKKKSMKFLRYIYYLFIHSYYGIKSKYIFSHSRIHSG
jgi:hypothetical protein